MPDSQIAKDCGRSFSRAPKDHSMTCPADVVVFSSTWISTDIVSLEDYFGMLLIWKEIFRLPFASTWCIRESPVAVGLSGPTSRGSIRNQRARFNDFASISRHVLSLKAFPCHDTEQSLQNLSGNRTGKSGLISFHKCLAPAWSSRSLGSLLK